MTDKKPNPHEDPYEDPYEAPKGFIDPNKTRILSEQRGVSPTYEDLLGCGDPTCENCNPHIVRRIFSSPMSEMEAELLQVLGFRGLEGSMGFSENGAPPPSYSKARKEVKQWLSKAPDQSFDDIVGNEEALEQLKDALEAPVLHKELYEAYGMKPPKGALLSGPPGCGKTMFARAAASEMRKLYGKEVEFISISGAELQQPYVGVTEGYIKAIFTFAREYQAHHGHPLLVFMDEAEVLLPDRTGRVRRVASWEESQVATFLAEMDGIESSGAFVLLASNRPEVIDQAVLRDGRCDFKIVVERPTYGAVETILRNNFKGVLAKDSTEELVFAALESLWDPHRILVEFHALGFNLAERDVKDFHQKHFLLEHIVSGAMAASIPNRAKRYAFSRDKAKGRARGVTVADVVTSVNDLFRENQGLDHSFALREFREEFIKEANRKKDNK